MLDQLAADTLELCAIAGFLISLGNASIALYNAWGVLLVLGVVGTLIGGFIGSALFNAPLEDFFSIQTWLLAIGGSILVLHIFGLVTRGRRS